MKTAEPIKNMIRPGHSLIALALLTAAAMAHATELPAWLLASDHRAQDTAVPVIADRSPLGLPSGRPLLSMNLPLLAGAQAGPGEAGDADGSFSWSLKAWQLNTASLAHIQCSQGMLTMNSYLAQDCRFVDHPLPHEPVHLVQLGGDWNAAPGLQLGLNAFHSSGAAPLANLPFSYDLLVDRRRPGAARLSDESALEGLDLNINIGIQTRRIGDFLVGLQLARYRQRMSLAEPGMSINGFQTFDTHYGNSAQLLLGWHHGQFSGEVLGHHREIPLWLGGSDIAPSTLSSFDLEFSWHAPRNASISIGVSNVMDAAPRSDASTSLDATLDEPLESVYGRIPYVRYKQDL